MLDGALNCEEAPKSTTTERAEEVNFKHIHSRLILIRLKPLI